MFLLYYFIIETPKMRSVFLCTYIIFTFFYSYFSYSKKFLCNVYFPAFHVGNSFLLCWLIFSSTQYSHKPLVKEANRIEFRRANNYQPHSRVEYPCFFSTFLLFIWICSISITHQRVGFVLSCMNLVGF